MHLYFEIFGHAIPSYGLMIVLGVITANLAALLMLKRNHHDVNDFLVLEAYVLLGAFVGAKGLYLLVSYKDIDWSRILEPAYFNQLMLGGFVFYGGLIGGLLFAVLAGRLHKLSFATFIREYIFLIPFIHGFGRIGCFLAGCCYGKPYSGVGAVVFPEGAYAPAGISLFPVQLVEAAMLILITLVLVILQLTRKWSYMVETYFILYGITRFVTEYFRYDEARGAFLMLSTSQWISILLIITAVALLIRRYYTGRLVSMRTEYEEQE